MPEDTLVDKVMHAAIIILGLAIGHLLAARWPPELAARGKFSCLDKPTSRDTMPVYEH